MSVFERWPGYDEQSWQQRFAELDRRYGEQQNKSIEFAMGVIVKRARSRDAAIEECAAVVERFGVFEAHGIRSQAHHEFLKAVASDLRALKQPAGGESAIDGGRG